MIWEVVPPLPFSGRVCVETGIISSLNVERKSPMKSPVPGVSFMERFSTTISFIEIRLLRLSLFLLSELFLKKINLFIYFWLRWVFVAAHRLSLVAASGGYSSLRWAGFSLWWLLVLWSTGSRCTGFSSCGLWALERRLSSCGARA